MSYTCEGRPSREGRQPCEEKAFSGGTLSYKGMHAFWETCGEKCTSEECSPAEGEAISRRDRRASASWVKEWNKSYFVVSFGKETLDWGCGVRLHHEKKWPVWLAYCYFLAAAL